MPYTLTFLQGDPLNTTLTNPGGAPAYIVDTPYKILGNRVTTVKRVDSSGDVLVASIEWIYPYDANSNVAFYGEEKRKVGNFMRPHPAQRYMECSGRQEYKWINFNELRDSKGYTKAKYIRADFEFKAMRWRNAVIDIFTDSAFTDKAEFCWTVDRIVVGLIILESWRRWYSRHPIGPWIR